MEARDIVRSPAILEFAGISPAEYKEKDLAEKKSAGRIRRIGGRKGGHWESFGRSDLIRSSS